MRSKLTMKHRHFKKVSLFIYSLIAVFSIIKPLEVYADMNNNDQYIYTHAVVSQMYEYVSARGGTSTASPKRMGLKYRIIVHLDGVYNGQYTYIVTSATNWSSQKYDITYINCYTDEYATILGTDLGQTIKFNGTSYFEVNITIWTENGNLQYSPLPSFCKLTGVDFDEFSNLYMLSRSEIQTMINIKNSLYNIEAYTDQLETLLGGINTDMSYVRSSLNDLYNRAGYISQQITTSNSLLTDIKDILNNMDFTTTPAEQTELQTFNTQNQTVQNIQSNLINHLTDTVDGTRTTPQYLQYQLVNNRDLQSYNLLNNLYTAINWPPITSGLFVQILRLIFMFVIIGVVLG